MLIANALNKAKSFRQRRSSILKKPTQPSVGLWQSEEADVISVVSRHFRNRVRVYGVGSPLGTNSRILDNAYVSPNITALRHALQLEGLTYVEHPVRIEALRAQHAHEVRYVCTPQR